MSPLRPSTADANPSAAEAASFSHHLRWLPWLILIVGLGLSWQQYHTTENRLKELERTRFELQAREITFRLERRLQANADVLRGVAGLFAASDHVDRSEFRTYVETLQLDVHYPGIQSVGFSQWVMTKDIPRLEAEIRAEGFPSFRVHPQANASHQSSIIYIEPFDWRNQRAFGFDMFSEPVRQQAMRRAVETGEPSLSGRVTLIQETEQDPQPGFLIYVPIYLKGSPPEGEDQRWEQLVGWAYSPIRAHDLLTSFLDNEFPILRQYMGLKLYAASEPSANALLYDSLPPMSGSANSLRFTSTLTLPGTAWHIEMQPLPDTPVLETPGWNHGILWAGGLLTVLLALLAHVLLRSHRLIQSALEQSVRTQRQLAESQAALRLAGTVMDASPLGIVATNARRRIVSVNPAFTRITGYGPDEAVGASTRLMDLRPLRNGSLKAVWQALEQQGTWEGEMESRRKDGSLYPMRLSITTVRDEHGAIQNYIGLCQDITEQHKAQENIRRLAHHDYLTGLPNRAMLVERAAIELQGAQRYGHRPAILFIDLDRFKPINDQLGHEAGDAVLIEVARRLSERLRESDLICRQGGDEFVVLMPDHHSTEGLLRLAEKLLQAIEMPYEVAGQRMTLSASIGIATYPEGGETVDDLIRSADAAMYRAKADPVRKVYVAGAPEDPSTG